MAVGELVETRKRQGGLISDGLRRSEDQPQGLTDWANEPTLLNLKYDFQSAKAPHDLQMGKIKRWNDLMRVEGAAKPKKVKGRSSVQPKLIRRQAEWRYSALTEPFLGSSKLFKVSPVTFEDHEAAKQNELVLNYQFRTKLNRVKFIDDYVRSTVDEGTSIVRTGWKRVVVKVKEKAPVWEHIQITTQEEMDVFKQALELNVSDPRAYEESVPPEIRAAVDYFEESQVPTVARQKGTEEVEVEKVLLNHPTVEVLNPENVYIDPSCEGDLAKAMYVIVSFETSKAELAKEPGRYKNLDQILWEGNSPLSQPDHATNTPEERTHDSLRKKVVAFEYWGFYNIKGGDELYPFVCTWIGNTIVRMETNPFPDQKLPFVVVPYLPVKRELMGEPDAELLEDNQAILGAVTRGMIDLMGRSANGQQGFAKGMLDPLNKRRFENGQDYEFNPNLSPANGHINHTYPEIPQSAPMMVQIQNQEAEALTGVKSFGGGISGDAYGEVAAGIRGVLDAASKREMAILRRLAKGMQEIGAKIISMNQAFLSEKETVRITNTEFVEVNREELAGDFDLEVDISTAEVDDAKSKDLGFMIQTMGPNMDPGMMTMILSEIAELKRMPKLAQMLKTYKPEPDPVAEETKKLELEKLRFEVEELKSKAKLNEAKAREADAEADNKDLEFVERESGTKHERDLEKQEGQAQGNKELAVTKALLNPRKADQSKPDIEAAVGFNEMTDAPGMRRKSRAAPVNPNGLPPTTEAVPVNDFQDRDALAEEDPRYSIGSRFYDPSLDPASNPGVNL
jgi:hypothetical protein